MSNLPEIIDFFTLPPRIVAQVAEQFRSALAGDPTDYGLKLLDSKFSRPTGQEQGEILVLDFGGTNLRLLLVVLQGNRVCKIIKQQVFSLRQNRSGQDLTSDSAQADHLFDYIAGEIGNFTEGNQDDYRLGHSFSFPARHLHRNSAILLEWTKEIKTQAVVGQDINGLLQKSLQRKGILHVQPRAIINDAVGTCLAGAYQYKAADVGSICGTGHNSCFMDSQNRLINIESGNFFDPVLPVTEFDRQLDESSSNPHAQRLEKMVAGAYLGELFRLILLNLAENASMLGQLNGLKEIIETPNCIESQDISALIAEREVVIAGLKFSASAPEISLLRNLARQLVVRSGQLVAATYAGIINHLDPQLEGQHTISIDGSLYDKMPYFSSAIQETLQMLYPSHRQKVGLCFSKNASGIGAAVAAAMS